MVENLEDFGEVDDLPQRTRNMEHHVLTEACTGLCQVTSDFTADIFDMTISIEALYVEEM